MYRIVFSVIFLTISSLVLSSDSGLSLQSPAEFTAIAQQAARIAVQRQKTTQATVSVLEEILQTKFKIQLLNELRKERYSELLEETAKGKKFFQGYEIKCRCLLTKFNRLMASNIDVARSVHTSRTSPTKPTKRPIFCEKAQLCSEPDDLTDHPICEWEHSEAPLKRAPLKTEDNTQQT